MWGGRVTGLPTGAPGCFERRLGGGDVGTEPALDHGVPAARDTAVGG